MFVKEIFKYNLCFNQCFIDYSFHVKQRIHKIWFYLCRMKYEDPKKKLKNIRPIVLFDIVYNTHIILYLFE